MYETFEKLMKEKGVSAYRVSKDCGIAQSTLSDWKSGKAEPKTDKLKRIADYFGVTVDYFLNPSNDDDKVVVPIVIEQCLKDTGMTDRLKLYAEFLLSQNKKTPE